MYVVQLCQKPYKDCEWGKDHPCLLCVAAPAFLIDFRNHYSLLLLIFILFLPEWGCVSHKE